MSLVKWSAHFSTWEKSAEVAGQVSARVPPHSSSWTPAAYEAPSGSDEWVELYDDVKSKTYCWNRRTNSTAWVAAGGCRGRLGRETGGRREVSGAGTSVLVSVRVPSHRCLLSDGLRGEGLGIPSPLHGCHLWQDDVLVCCSFGGESGYIYSDMLENSCGVAVIAGWFCCL